MLHCCQLVLFKILLPGFRVNDHDDVFSLVSFISVAILFLVIAFSQINFAVAIWPVTGQGFQNTK